MSEITDREYQVLSLHDSYEAADILMQMWLSFCR